jgi:cell division protein FtsI/penicillin-binding protein 2
VTARSRERGSHAGRSRSYGLPFTVRGLSSLGTLGSARNGGRRAAQPAVGATLAPGVPELSESSALPGARALPDSPGRPGEAPARNDAMTLPEAPAGPGRPGWPAGIGGKTADGTATGSVNGAASGSAPRPVFTPAPAERTAPRPAGAPPQGRPPGGRRSRHRKPQEPQRTQRSKKLRLAAVLVVVAAVVGAGFFADGFGSEASAEPTVQAFLLDWQQGHYAQAAALTDGSAKDVGTQLAAAYTDLDASNAFFSLDHVTQHGRTAVASYKATVDLAQGGQQWSYVGKFSLTSRGGHWVVHWAPAVINPRLTAGERLAVVTSFAQRAGVEDMDGQPLVAKSADYRIGVYPGQLKNPAKTATGFSALTGLDSEQGQQVLGQIQAAPPGTFLSLLTLDPAGFGSLWPKLGKVPGLSYQRQDERLFDSSAQEAVGQVGTENSAELRNEGAAYQPGMTVGLTGLEKTYQNELVGTPTTSVVVVNAAGHNVATLSSSATGHAGTPVKTTISGKVQAAAATALAAQSHSAEIVAVDTATGAIRALASRETGSTELPAGGVLDAKIEPGMAFSIVSAAALLSSGVSVNHLLPCEPVADVGGETFTYQPAASTTSTLASDFAEGCGTAFANMSRTLTPQQLTSAERSFGVGATWQLPLLSFSGSAPAVSGEAAVAAQATGTGGVLMSPLGLATIAAEAASGAGHSPVLTAADSSTSWQAPLSAAELTELRQLMRLAVTKGSAQAANLPGTPVYGQAGVVQSGKHAYLSWFVGYRGSLAVAVLETGSTASQAAAALAGHFLNGAG